MAISFITGTECTLSIGSHDYSEQITKFELTYEVDSATKQTLGGSVAYQKGKSGKLKLSALWDGLAAQSLYNALWTAADTGATITFAAAAGFVEWSGKVVAVYPPFTADAEDISEYEIELPTSGTITYSTTPPPEGTP